jgi:hypothetical protein
MNNQEFEKWDKEIDNISANKSELFLEISKKEKNSETLWRLAKVELILSYISINKKDKENDKKYVLDALKHSKEAVDLSPESINCLKWYCAAAGRATSFVDTKERIRLGHQLKESLDKALSLSPKDYLLHYIHGRWCFEVSGLTVVERTLAPLFFGKLPESTYEDALRAFNQANTLKSDWKMNLFWQAKALIAKKAKQDAKEIVNFALGLENLNEEDSVAHKELINLKNEINKN